MGELRWTTAGESHGDSLVAILEGMPAGLALDVGRVDRELERRQRGYGRGKRMQIERDRVEVLAGVRGGRTLGSPVALRVVNRDAKLERMDSPSTPRPGHADLAGCQRLGERDVRAVSERASARETAARVALAGVARQVLEHFDVEVFAHVVELGGEVAELEEGLFDGTRRAEREERRDASEFHCLDERADGRFRARVDAAREDRDSLGGIFEVRALGLPPGLGSYLSGPERLTGRLAGALLSIPAMKGVEFGLGFEAARRPGSAVHDPIVPAAPEARWGRFARASNHAGGLEGGLTTGEPLVARVAMKPIPTLLRGLPTVDLESGEAVRAAYERSDVTAVPAASVVGEALVALELARAFLERFGAPSLAQTEAAYGAARRQLRQL
jgi:chorismate synthase